MGSRRRVGLDPLLRYMYAGACILLLQQQSRETTVLPSADSSPAGAVGCTMSLGPTFAINSYIASPPCLRELTPTRYKCKCVPGILGCLCEGTHPDEKDGVSPVHARVCPAFSCMHPQTRTRLSVCLLLFKALCAPQPAEWLACTAFRCNAHCAAFCFCLFPAFSSPAGTFSSWSPPGSWTFSS